MTTIHWLIISIFLFDTGYYIGRWVGRSQELGKALRAKLFASKRKTEPSEAEEIIIDTTFEL